MLYYADRVYQLPLALFGIALSVVLLPELTRRLQSEGEASAREGLNRGLEYALLLTLPATVALMTIPLPITRTLFERGAYTSAGLGRRQRWRSSPMPRACRPSC